MRTMLTRGGQLRLVFPRCESRGRPIFSALASKRTDPTLNTRKCQTRQLERGRRSSAAEEIDRKIISTPSKRQEPHSSSYHGRSTRTGSLMTDPSEEVSGRDAVHIIVLVEHFRWSRHISLSPSPYALCDDTGDDEDEDEGERNGERD